MQIEPRHAATFGPYRALGKLVESQVLANPAHIPFLTRRFQAASEKELELCNELAEQVLLLAGDELDEYLTGYDFICEIQKREEVYFRRHGTYRLTSVEQATEEVYSNREYMRKYMRGLLMTQVLWSNHAASMRFYMEEFLAKNREGYRLLEIGPGHGLLLSRAAADPRAASVSAWDLSPASLRESQEALERLGIRQGYTLHVRNLFDSEGMQPQFDAVVLSEVLEHLDEPERALQALKRVMHDGGRLYLNVPINSPAPDHVFLLRSPEEAVSFVRDQGFEIEAAEFFPATNYSLEAARKHALTISVCMVATRPPA